MKLFVFLLLINILCSYSQSSAANDQQKGQILGFVGVASQYPLLDNPPSEFRSSSRTAFEVKAEGRLSEKGALAIGITFMDKFFSRSEAGSKIAQMARRVHIATGYRRWLEPNLSVATSFYSSYAFGDPQTVTTSGPDIGLGTSAADSVDYGFDFSLRPEPEAFKKMNIALDLFYSRMITQKENESADHFGILLSYFWQTN